MKKINLKSTLAMVAVAASCLGAWKAYDTYGSVDNSLMMENIEALSNPSEVQKWNLHHCYTLPMAHPGNSTNYQYSCSEKCPTYEEAKKYKESQCDCWEKNIIPSTWSPHLGCWKKE